MRKFWKWLGGNPARPRSLASITKVVLAALIVDLCWTCFMDFVLIYIVNIPQGLSREMPTLWELLIYAPTLEEFIFRLLPALVILVIMETMLIDDYQTMKREVFLWAAIISSAIFGIIHGSFINLFFQGVGGLVLWVVFLYGSRMGKDLFRGYASSVALHSLYNLSILIINSL